MLGEDNTLLEITHTLEEMRKLVEYDTKFCHVFIFSKLAFGAQFNLDPFKQSTVLSIAIGQIEFVKFCTEQFSKTGLEAYRHHMLDVISQLCPSKCTVLLVTLNRKSSEEIIPLFEKLNELSKSVPEARSDQSPGDIVEKFLVSSGITVNAFSLSDDDQYINRMREFFSETQDKIKSLKDEKLDKLSNKDKVVIGKIETDIENTNKLMENPNNKLNETSYEGIKSNIEQLLAELYL